MRVAAPGAALPTFAEFAAPPAWRRIDFISDLHLAADIPQTFDAWAAYMQATPADAVFILGDLFDAWVGDDARHEGFEARCCDVLMRAAGQRRVGFMAGNRDFLVGAAMLEDCGVMALPDPTVLSAFGERVLLTHGDALCLADTEYQRYRAMVRNPQWQAQGLALPLAERRRIAAQMRHTSEQRNANGELPADAVDLDRAATLAWMGAAAAPVLVHGHTHRPGSETLAPGFQRHVLTDWDLDHAGRQGRAGVLCLTGGGFARLPLAAAMQSPPAP